MRKHRGGEGAFAKDVLCYKHSRCGGHRNCGTRYRNGPRARGKDSRAHQSRPHSVDALMLRCGCVTIISSISIYFATSAQPRCRRRSDYVNRCCLKYIPTHIAYTDISYKNTLEKLDEYDSQNSFDWSTALNRETEPCAGCGSPHGRRERSKLHSMINYKGRDTCFIRTGVRAGYYLFIYSRRCACASQQPKGQTYL